MGLLYKRFLNGKVYCCSNCKTHLACHQGIVSTAFEGIHGSAYLFNSV